MQKKSHAPQEEKPKPQVHKPLNTISKTDEILDKITKATQEVEAIYWSCDNGPSRGGSCGCCYGHEGENTSSRHTKPPGASKKNLIYYSKRKSDWACNPVRVRVRNGKVVGKVE